MLGFLYGHKRIFTITTEITLGIVLLAGWVKIAAVTGTGFVTCLLGSVLSQVQPIPSRDYMLFITK